LRRFGGGVILPGEGDQPEEAEMDIKFPRDLQPFVDEQIARGRYSDVWELILDAVYVLRDQVELLRIKYERLKKDVASGIEQLDRGEGIDGPTFFQQLRERIQSKTDGSQ
jgi:antitoxin ParD1/3/4